MGPFFLLDHIFLYLIYQNTSITKPITMPNREYTYRFVTKKQYFRSSYDCCINCCWDCVFGSCCCSCPPSFCCCCCCCCTSTPGFTKLLLVSIFLSSLELLLVRGKELIWVIQLLPSMFNIIAKTENIQMNKVEIFR